MENVITEATLKSLQEGLSEKELIVLKFTADWCGPCKNIKDLCSQFNNTKPASIQYYEIDIDESIELYMKLKKMKMLNGIPALFAYKSGSKDFWFVPDDSQVGSDRQNVIAFFNRCLNYVS